MAPIFREALSSPAGGRSPSDVVEIVRDAIVAGHLAPNERLVELDLARDLDTNRAVVRGALDRLEQQRLVVREPNRGVRVRSYSAAEAAEILETRALLEGLVARRAAQRVDDDGGRALESIVADMRDRLATGELAAYSLLNARLHRTLLDIARHPTATMLLAVLQSQAVRYQFRTVFEPGRSGRSLAEHEAIVAAVRAHDPDAAERAMHAHIGAVVATVRAIGGRDAFASD